jgi:UDP:flavonoid glycosyltransferase YjiC (YdhE family)
MNLPLWRACLSPQAVDEAVAGDAQADRWLGFFPDWFGSPGAGWPDIALTGFPALDDSLVPALEPKLENFLDAGPAPIVFTPGSFQRRSSRFFRESLAACRALGQRAVLLTPYADQVPANLPDGVMHLAYAPLHRLAARAAALVHHGGIGTLSQGLRSGAAQVCAPVFFDQFDNARRLEKLGVSRTLPLRDYTSSALAPLLQAVLGDAKTREQSRAIRDRMADGNPVEAICDLIGAATVSPAGPV